MATLSDNIDDYCFFDTETRPLPRTPEEAWSVKDCGAHRYAVGARPIILTYAIGDAPVQCVTVSADLSRPLRFADLPLDLRLFYSRQRPHYFCAWNATFDRLIWNAAFTTQTLELRSVIDVMAQGVASNLPPSLGGAAMVLKLAGKLDEGKDLIRLFCTPDGPTPAQEPERWARFCEYGVRDTDLLRAVFKATRKLPAREWEEYWANEEINDRGMSIDLPLVHAAAKAAGLAKEIANEQINEATGGEIERVTMIQRLTSWVYDGLRYAEAREIMVKDFSEPEDEGDLPEAKLGLDRPRIEALLAFFGALEERDDGLDDTDFAIATALELRLWGGSASPQKFSKMLLQHVGGKLRGQYVFNGANQTGRFSSRGVQVHNLTRAHLGEREKDAINMLIDANTGD